MNFRLLNKLLGIVSLLIGVTMIFSLPWAHPSLGYRVGLETSAAPEFEWNGFLGICGSIVVCGIVGGILMWLGRKAEGQLYRKEAMAVVGLSWVLATFLGALPFLLSQTYRGPSVRLFGEHIEPQVAPLGTFQWTHWTKTKRTVSGDAYKILARLTEDAVGLNASELTQLQPQGISLLKKLRDDYPNLKRAIVFPGEDDSAPADRKNNYRIRWCRMNIGDCLFESQSGFSTTGATVISDLEDPHLVSHCILFWRSSTHFLGGLGIIVLFVVILGQGSAGKALMRAEMPGPTKEGSTARMQHTAWMFAAMYCGLNLVLAVALWLLNLSAFDALCHAFGTLATGGFSTYNTSVGHFTLNPQSYNGPAIDYLIISFMGLAGTNFTLLYLMLLGQPLKLLKDVEWQVYFGIIMLATTIVVFLGLYGESADGGFKNFADAVRYGLFQVVAVLTTTGYGTHDFNGWHNFSRGMLFMLMFVGGCAGSTGGGMKVIRHILFVKILRLEVEHAYHPSVVRPLRLGGEPVTDQDLRKNILVYFSLILIIFINSWLLLIAIEPGLTWGDNEEHKLLDSATAIAATLNNIGPGLGTVGATSNYGHFTQASKVLFVWLMMIGRIEIFSILVLFAPGFWRNH